MTRGSGATSGGAGGARRDGGGGAGRRQRLAEAIMRAHLYDARATMIGERS
ncbi:MAG TPA: hypothetical protein VFW27_37265 [Actinoplanes sp.]|nr:hypothetical protein [Actinoplanes sp.]